MLFVAYLAALVIGPAAFRSGPRSPVARAAALAVGVLAATAGAGLTLDARTEGHTLDEVGLTVLLGAGGILLAAGAAIWRGTPAHALRVAGLAVVAAVTAVPSTLTLVLPIAALAAGGLHAAPSEDAVRAGR